MSNPRVLLLGGHGKIARLLTPLLLNRSWDVTSVIRNPDHTSDILKLGQGKKGKVEVLISSLDDVKSVDDAKAIVDRAKPDYVVWAAGAGGKGGPLRTFTIDRDTAKHFITATFTNPSITKVLLISHIGSRRKQPPWLSADTWARFEHINQDVLPDYYQAKLAADEYFTAMARKRAAMDDEAEARGGAAGEGPRKRFQAILLRPGPLMDAPATWKVELGKTKEVVLEGGVPANVSREDVAIVADRLLARDDTRGWLDLLGGDDEIEEAVERAVRDRVDAVEGEDVDKMCEGITL
ncbi:NAD dependent epimerase/dehydratase [Histoplasma capsulatum var. duboisii H88]|uniref:NAD dependent epimerase/dehydratase n=1 Tax=Ajellomyces capsulatus (strain H88) TaxID=544711 RepID=F0URJ5_AJEC8|nr:NAD dependent epimerase/dehydratase [Histoplasma capsulatum var. duboisii H88]QSS50536.1 NAD dependent epimerase/dehydratase [Histoplasma capsulatum var. duboisii H88]